MHENLSNSESHYVNARKSFSLRLHILSFTPSNIHFPVLFSFILALFYTFQHYLCLKQKHTCLLFVFMCMHLWTGMFDHRGIWRPESEGRMYFLIPLTSYIFRHLFNLEFTLSARQAGQCVMGICLCMFLHSSGSQPCTVPHWTIWQKHSLLGFVILNSDSCLPE